jgi:hypothetical protein
LARRAHMTIVRIIHLNAYPKNTKEIRAIWGESTKAASSLAGSTDPACKIAIHSRTIKRALTSILASRTVRPICRVVMLIPRPNMLFSPIEFPHQILSRTRIHLSRRSREADMVRAQWRSRPMPRSPGTSARDPNKSRPLSRSWQQTFWKSRPKERKAVKSFDLFYLRWKDSTPLISLWS